MDHQKQDEVKGKEFRSLVLVANREVNQQGKNERGDEHDWDLSNHLRCCVNPNVVHVSSTFSHEHRLFTLEHDNGGQEVEEHLHDTQEVSGSNHRGIVGLSFFDLSLLRVISACYKIWVGIFVGC